MCIEEIYNGFRVYIGYVNTEIILHFFYKITNERGTKTVFTYAHVKWFYGQSERAYYLNYFLKGELKMALTCLKQWDMKKNEVIANQIFFV